MVNITDVVIIAIALMAALGALLLLRPQADQQEVYKIRKLRSKAEQDQQAITEVLSSLQRGANDAEGLTKQLKTQVEQINKQNQASQARAEIAERAIDKAKAAENELRAISSQLGERIQFVQTYWDEQLTDTTESIKQVRTKLDMGLTKVDEGLLRMREQEKMAHGFTQKLLEHQKDHLTAQQKNASLSAEVHAQLEKMLAESTLSLQKLQEQHQQADLLFVRYTDEISALEQQAQEQFTEIFQTTDVARQELSSGVKEMRAHTEKLREYEIDGKQMNQRIREQFATVDGLKLDRLGQTVELTDEMCANLQAGLENARALMSTLEAKTAELIQASEEEEPPAAERSSVVRAPESGKSRNLFSLRAYR